MFVIDMKRKSLTADEPITVLLIDARPWTREAYTRALNLAADDLQVVSFADVSEIDHAAFKGKKALVLLNLTGIALHDEGASAAIDSVRSRLPGISIAVISDSVDGAEILRVLESGSSAYVPISLALQRVVDALRLVAAGGVFMPIEPVLAGMVDLATPVRQAYQPDGGGTEIEHISGAARSIESNITNVSVLEAMTPKEQAVLAPLCKGMSNKLIARELDISEATIKVHVRHIMRKLGVANRTQVALLVDRLAEDLDLSTSGMGAGDEGQKSGSR